MDTAKFITAIAISGFLIVGLLYSPVCNLNCAFYECAPTVATKATQETDQSSHCHRHTDTKPPAAHSTTPHQSVPHDGSKNCPAHDDAMLLPAGASPTVAMNQLAQPLVAVLPMAIRVSFDDLLDHPPTRAPLRSPPTRAPILPLRI